MTAAPPGLRGRSPYVHRFTHLDAIVIGVPAAQAIPEQARLLGAQRVVVVTSPSLAHSPLVRSVELGLSERHAGTFGGVRAHSPRDCVLAAAALARASGADLLVAIGGGSVIDAVKVVQLCLWHDLATSADLQGFRDRGCPPLAAGVPARPRAIAAPTTLSAAEFNPLAGVTDPATDRKEPYEDPALAPQVVVLDPAALAQSPVDLTLSTGVRALDHCIEGFCSSAARPFYDALAIGALKLLWRRLPEVKRGVADLTAFEDLQTAAWMAITGPAAGVPVGASHGIGRVLGAVANVAHGHTSAILLPAVLGWNARDRDAAARQAQLAAELGLGDVDLAQAVGDFISALGQPRRLSEAGVRRDHFAKISAFGLDMLSHPSVNGNARPVTCAQDIEEILERAW